MRFTTKTQISGESQLSFVNIKHPQAHSLLGAGLHNVILGTIKKPYLLERSGDEFVDHAVWIYTHTGSAVMETSNKTVVLDAGTLCCLPGHLPRRMTLQEEPWVRVSYVLRSDNVSLLHHPKDIACAPCPDGPRLFGAVEGLIAEQQSLADSNEGVELYSNLLVYHMKRASRLFGKSGNAEMANRFNLLWAEVRGDLSKRWTVATLAKRIFVSDSYLHQTCCKLYGTSPLQYVKRLRMTQAKQLLVNTSCPLKVIAEMIGYKSVYAFSNAFHKATGQRPGAARKAAGT